MLEEVEVLDRHIQLLEKCVDCGYRCFHDVLRRHASRGVSENPRHGLKSQPLRLLLGNHHEGSRPIAELGSIAGRDHAILLEHRGQLSQPLEGCVGSHAFVDLEKGLSLGALDRDGGNLVLEAA